MENEKNGVGISLVHREAIQFLFCCDPLHTGQFFFFFAFLYNDSYKHSEMNNVYGVNYKRWSDKYSLKTSLQVIGCKKADKFVNNILVKEPRWETLAQRRLIARICALLKA